MAKDTHRGHLLLHITPPYCIIPTVTFSMWQSNFWYFCVNSSCLYVLSHKFISRITLTFRFNLTSHAKNIVLCGVSHLVINIIWGITRVWCFISCITLVVDPHLLCHTLSFVVSLFKFWQLDPVFPYWEVMAKDMHRGSVATYLCMGFSLNTNAEDTSGYIVGTYIISDWVERQSWDKKTHCH